MAMRMSVQALLVCCCLGWSWGGATAAEQPRAAPKKPAAETTTAKVRKWDVGQQLVQNRPWGSEKRSEAEMLKNVKEAEATPDQRLVLALKDLAGWYRGQKRVADAETTYKRILKFQQDRIGPNHHDVALNHNDLGVFYTETGKYPEAEAQFKRALELWEKSWDMPMKTVDNAVTFHNYALLLEKVGRSADAKTMEGKGEEIMRERDRILLGK